MSANRKRRSSNNPPSLKEISEGIFATTGSDTNPVTSDPDGGHLVRSLAATACTVDIVLRCTVRRPNRLATVGAAGRASMSLLCRTCNPNIPVEQSFCHSQRSVTHKPGSTGYIRLSAMNPASSFSLSCRIKPPVVRPSSKPVPGPTTSSRTPLSRDAADRPQPDRPHSQPLAWP